MGEARKMIYTNENRWYIGVGWLGVKQFFNAANILYETIIF